MPKAPTKKEFVKTFDDLQAVIDVDDSAGRSVPINMNFTEEGFLTKDTGFVPCGQSEDVLCHSLFNYKKKGGTSYQIRSKGTKLQTYNAVDRLWTDIPGSPTFTEGAEFGFVVYDDLLYLGNAVESMYTWDGTTFTAYASAPKGNIFEVFEDRVFVAGVTAQPLTVYYSNVGNGTTFGGSDLVQPLGADSVVNLKNYYGSLLIFKQESIVKLTFIYDSVVSLYVPKLEVQSGTYGACSRKAVAWVENEIWFFTGSEVRAIGFSNTVSGIFGINKSVISEPIKETLKTLAIANLSKVVCFYNNRRFYLGVPLVASTVDTIFVCHTLYANSWTKYSSRDKAKVNDFMAIDKTIYSSASSVPYGIIKWTVETADTEELINILITES